MLRTLASRTFLDGRLGSSLLEFSFISIICLGLSTEAAQKKGAGAGIFAADKGKLNILLDGKSVGHEEFEISPSGAGWVAKGSTSFKPPDGPQTHVTGNLTLQPDGAPISYDWTSQSEKTNGAHVMFANGVARMTLQMQGIKPFDQDFTFSSPTIIVLDNNLYHQYAVLARVYDWSRRGTQNFSVLIPQERTPGTITVDWARRRIRRREILRRPEGPHLRPRSRSLPRR